MKGRSISKNIWFMIPARLSRGVSGHSVKTLNNTPKHRPTKHWYCFAGGDIHSWGWNISAEAGSTTADYSSCATNLASHCFAAASVSTPRASMAALQQGNACTTSPPVQTTCTWPNRLHPQGCHGGAMGVPRKLFVSNLFGVHETQQVSDANSKHAKSS